MLKRLALFVALAIMLTAAPAAAHSEDEAAHHWRLDPEVSFYGPGFYGHRTACGQVLTPSTVGVAHRSLPCGTAVRFRNQRNGDEVVVRVLDRGPYVRGRTWDLTAGACHQIDSCKTQSLYWTR